MLRRSYDIKRGYRPRRPSALSAAAHNTPVAPRVCDLARFLVEVGGFGHVVLLGTAVVDQFNGLDEGCQLVIITGDAGRVPSWSPPAGGQLIEHDLERGLPVLDPALLLDSVFVVAGVLECLAEPHRLLRDLGKLASQVPFLLLTTPDRTRLRGPEDVGPPGDLSNVREWSIDEFDAVLSRYAISAHLGHTMSAEIDLSKTATVAIGGRLATWVRPPRPVTALAVMEVYNEEDVLEHSVNHLLTQGLDVHIVDNWSTDGSLELVQRLAAMHPNVTFEQFPVERPEVNNYSLVALLERVQEISAAAPHDWVIHNDADEIRLAPWPGVTLREALGFISAAGFNAIDFTVLDFRPTADGYDGSISPEGFFDRCEFRGFPSYFMQVKGWSTQAPVTLTETGGHIAEFSDKRVFPLKFLLKHYSVRSVAHGRRKIFRDRVGRFSEVERAKGWHVQYDGMTEDQVTLWSGVGLEHFSMPYFAAEFLIELVSGVGIRRDAV